MPQNTPRIDDLLADAQTRTCKQDSTAKSQQYPLDLPPELDARLEVVKALAADQTPPPNPSGTNEGDPEPGGPTPSRGNPSVPER